MAILFSGDFHGNAQGELSLITRKNLRRKYGPEKYEPINWHIILGDGGFFWPGQDKTNAYNIQILGERRFPVLCVIGNHEPMLGMKLPEADIGIGETVLLINEKPLIAYLKRGAVYQLESRRFLVLGGALSIDRAMRVPGRSWWEKEYWDDAEKAALFRLLERENRFDYVLSHTGPESVNRMLFYGSNQASRKFTDEVAVLNGEVDSRIQCCGWFCGHWHEDRLLEDQERNRFYRYLYRETELL